MIDKSEPLMGWAVNTMGLYLEQHLQPNKEYTIEELIDLINTAKRKYREVKAVAADIGKEAHEWAKNYVKGLNPDMPENPKVLNSVTAFLKWYKETNIKPISVEEIIYSKKYNYAGILDLEGKIDNKYFSIIDYKTGSGIYPEMRYQRAAYQHAKEEMIGRKYGDGWIIRFDKETAEFEAKCIPASEQAKDFKAFLGALSIKRREQELKS